MVIDSCSFYEIRKPDQACMAILWILWYNLHITGDIK